MADKSFAAFSKVTKNSWTDHITVIYGSYSWLNECPIHYCQTSISVQNLWEDVRLMSEMPGVEKWGFEALFQRMIKEDWVKQIKTQYISNRDRFKFFPPITLALLPCVNNLPQKDYGCDAEFSFQPRDQGGFSATVGGLEIGFPTVSTAGFPKFGEPALVRWDRTKFLALAIDGQHRISALREFISRQDQNAPLSDIPATILIFDPKLPIDRDLVQMTREIFIDINKNAKTVDDSRLILLDDRTFYNGLTRKLILQAYPDGENVSKVKYIKPEDDFDLEIVAGIPQELIDTSAGRESADVTKLKPWQFTSAFILSRAIQYSFFEDKFSAFEELVETKDFKEDSDDEMMRTIASRMREFREFEADDDVDGADKDLLSFRPAITEKVVDRAHKIQANFLLGAFTAFLPYRTHILKFKAVVDGDYGDDIRSILLSEGSLPAGSTTEFRSPKSQELRRDVDRWKLIEREIAKLAKPADWLGSLVWYSIFQRALVYQPRLLRTAMGLSRNCAYDATLEFASDYIKALNTLFSSGLLSRAAMVDSRPIWNGIALKFGSSGEGVIDGSDMAAKRIGLMLRLLVSAVVARDSGGYQVLKQSKGKLGFKSAWTELRKGIGRFRRASDIAGDPASDKGEDFYQSDADGFLEEILVAVADEKI
jgi:hypothetical protein